MNLFLGVGRSFTPLSEKRKHLADFYRLACGARHEPNGLTLFVIPVFLFPKRRSTRVHLTLFISDECIVRPG
jgi:hypothetical protein